ncbi:zinc finger-containing ubiquitin peptidase 1-like isoform X2 [Lineus longissimus]|uniref:zinc finger-containing ubiquitin peptidase 1-like isoform X2 n=1 Tax=Lineus longissimus TaxID=88925 RepID=UPI00315C882A
MGTNYCKLGHHHSKRKAVKAPPPSTPPIKPKMAEGGEQLFTCDICGQEGLTDDDMKSHVLIEHVEGAISCPFCDLEGTTAEEMTWHINAEHLDILSPTKSLPPSDFPPSDFPLITTEIIIEKDMGIKPEERENSDSSLSSASASTPKSKDSLDSDCASMASTPKSKDSLDSECTSIASTPKSKDSLDSDCTSVASTPKNKESNFNCTGMGVIPKSKGTSNLNFAISKNGEKSTNSKALHEKESSDSSIASQLSDTKMDIETKMEISSDTSESPSEQKYDYDAMQMIRMSEEDQFKKRAKLHLDMSTASPRKNRKVTFNDTVRSSYTEKMQSGKDIQVVRIDDDPGESSSGSGSSSNCVNNNKDVIKFSCPLCEWNTLSPGEITRHVNVQHLDLLSPSPRGMSPGVLIERDSENNVINNDSGNGNSIVPECPICGIGLDSAVALELHVNTTHLDILSPDSAHGNNPTLQVGTPDMLRHCPICGMEDFEPYSLAQHVEGHFSAEQTPVTDVSDNMLAQELERRERQAEQFKEQEEFKKLQAMYGMDNKTDFIKQSEKGMERAVYNGQMSIGDFYSRKGDLQQANAIGVDDGHSCTKGIIPKLQEFYNNNVNNNPIVNWWMCSEVDHYASTYGDKGWGCGYRNLQMLLSCLATNTTYKQVLFNGRPMIPSIPKIQRLIEAAWEKSFDLQGCEQLGGKVVNTNKWIGATEVVATLSSLRIQCALVDFHAPSGTDGTHPRMFEWVHDYFKKKDDFKAPLYLQHHGHSRTIIGCEDLKDGSVRLLIYDPIYTRKQMQLFKGTINTNLMRTIRRTVNSMKAKQYQIVAVTGVLSDHEYEESKILKSERIP